MSDEDAPDWDGQEPSEVEYGLFAEPEEPDTDTASSVQTISGALPELLDRRGLGKAGARTVASICQKLIDGTITFAEVKTTRVLRGIEFVDGDLSLGVVGGPPPTRRVDIRSFFQTNVEAPRPAPKKPRVEQPPSSEPASGSAVVVASALTADTGSPASSSRDPVAAPFILADLRARVEGALPGGDSRRRGNVRVPKPHLPERNARGTAPRAGTRQLSAARASAPAPAPGARNTLGDIRLPTGSAGERILHCPGGVDVIENFDLPPATSLAQARPTAGGNTKPSNRWQHTVQSKSLGRTTPASAKLE